MNVIRVTGVGVLLCFALAACGASLASTVPYSVGRTFGPRVPVAPQNAAYNAQLARWLLYVIDENAPPDVFIPAPGTVAVNQNAYPQGSQEQLDAETQRVQQMQMNATVRNMIMNTNNFNMQMLSQ